MLRSFGSTVFILAKIRSKQLDRSYTKSDRISDNIRKVNTTRYEIVEGIATNSHALLEVSTDSKTFFIFDPFLAIYLIDRDGRLLSSRNIRDIRNRNLLSSVTPCEIRSVPSQQGNGVALRRSSLEDTDAHNYNYWSQFVYIHYLNLVEQH